MTSAQRSPHVYVGIIVAAAAAALLGLRGVEPVAPARLSAFALVPLFALSEVFVVHFQARRSSHTFSLVEIPLVVGLLFVSPTALVIAHVVGGGAALAFHRTQRSLKLVFNMSSFVVQDAAAVACFAAIASDGRSDQPRTWLAVGAGCAIASVAGIVLVSGAIRLAGDRAPGPERAQAIAFGLAATSITTSTALAIASLADDHGPAALLVVLPIVAIYLAHRSYVQARQERRHVDVLHDAAELLVPDPTGRPMSRCTSCCAVCRTCSQSKRLCSSSTARRRTSRRG